MGAVLKELQRSKAIRRGRVAFGLLMTVVGLIGFAGIKEDLGTWGNWLGGLGSDVVAFVLYAVLVAIGVTLLAIEGYRPRTRRHVDVPTRSAGPQHEPESASVAPPPGPHDRAPDDEPTAGPARRGPGGRLRPTAGPKLSDRLQARLDEGVALRREIPVMPGIGVTGILRPETTEADATMWIKRTERILRKADPELLSEFRYRPGRALIDSLGGRTILDPPRYTKDLDRRIANLRGIIEDLRDQGR